MARPSPRVPPVTSATRPERSNGPRTWRGARRWAACGSSPARAIRDGPAARPPAARARPRAVARSRSARTREPSAPTRSATAPAASSSSRLPTTSQTTSSGCSSTVRSGHSPPAISNAVRGPSPRMARMRVAPATMVAQPRGDEPPVIRDGRAVAGQQPGERHRLRALEVLEIAQARARTAVLRAIGRADLRVRGDPGQQVVADERDALALVHEQRVRRAVAGARDDPQAAAARAQPVTVGQPDVGAGRSRWWRGCSPRTPRCRR